MHSAMKLILCLLFLHVVLSFSFIPGKIKFGVNLKNSVHARQNRVQNDRLNRDTDNINLMTPLADSNRKLWSSKRADSPPKGLDSFESDPLSPKNSNLNLPTSCGDLLKRERMHAKMDFHRRYAVPILPDYKAFLSDFIGAMFSLTSDPTFECDALTAFGICTQYYTLMKEYVLRDQVRYNDNIVNIVVQL